jgi:hypothetical protein
MNELRVYHSHLPLEGQHHIHYNAFPLEQKVSNLLSDVLAYHKTQMMALSILFFEHAYELPKILQKWLVRRAP